VRDGATAVTLSADAAIGLPYFAQHGIAADPHICAIESTHPGPHECACDYRWPVTP
jgi:hypothetical protein